jgi:hypothetical protein
MSKNEKKAFYHTNTRPDLFTLRLYNILYLTHAGPLPFEVEGLGHLAISQYFLVQITPRSEVYRRKLNEWKSNQ